MRANFSRYLSDKITELFLENLKAPRKEEYLAFTTPKKSTKDEEKYDSIGNLSAAEEKTEGGPLHYEQLSQMYQTTVINKTYDRGFTETWEAVEDDVEKVIGKVNTGGMIRAMITKREKNVAAVVDGVFTTTSADGVAYAADNHPLDTSKTAAVNDNLMAAGAITPDNVITGCNMFNDIMDYAGNPFDTSATAILAHSNNGANIKAVLESNLKASELSNTKNTVPTLKVILGRYISKTYWHLLDENIPSFIFQRRTNLQPFDDQDTRSTLNYYWAMVERYRAAQINPGFGHVSNAYAG
jgi:hypothetical protein